MKKIIFFMPNIHRGGIEKNLILLSNYFINRKYLVEIYFTEISKEVKSQLNFKAKLIKSKKFIKIGSNNRMINSINCGIGALLNLKKEKKNIIISMQDHPISIIIGKIKGIKCAIRISNHPESSLKFFNSFLKFKLKLLIKIFFYKFSDTIICNSRESKKFLNQYINKKKIYFINNPIELKKNKIQKKKKNNFSNRKD
jgi:glycosyltransferase involved in cell wall biosynthesis